MTKVQIVGTPSVISSVKRLAEDVVPARVINLRAMKSRCENLNPTASTLHNSHTNYRYLSNKDLATRLKNVQAAKRAAVRSASRLNGKLQAMIEKEGIDLGEEDASDMEDLMGEVDESVKAKKHFRCIFQYIFSFTKLHYQFFTK